MSDKILNPTLTIDSRDLIEKVKISLEKAGMFTIHWLPEPINLDILKELFELDTDFNRGHCPACNGYTFAFKSKNKEIEKDLGGLCPHCGAILAVLALADAPEEDIVNWMTSEGEVNPLELIKEAVQK